MISSTRFSDAVNKLYSAFHENRLFPECARQCAVGNILDRSDFWKHFSDTHGSITLNYIGHVNQGFGKTFNGYTPLELLKIECAFLQGCGFTIPLHYKNTKPKITKDLLFNGLEAVIGLLCQFEGKANVMDCSQLFNYKSPNTTITELASAI